MTDKQTDRQTNQVSYILDAHLDRESSQKIPVSEVDIIKIFADH